MPLLAHRGRLEDEQGFVLILVLFVVAALTVTVSGSLMVTRTELETARSGVDATRAFHLAQAGLTRYVGDRAAWAADSTVYTMGGGRVVVRRSRVAVAGIDETWEIASRATIGERSAPESREVRQLARLELRPFNPVAGFATTARNISVSGTYSGTDVSSSGQCPSAARGHVTGLGGVTGGYLSSGGSTFEGQPGTRFEADTATMRSRMSAEWDEMVDSATPFEYEVPNVAWPDFASLAADAYPSIRVRGNIRLEAGHSGRGLLIVDGLLDFGAGFTWDGAILAGDLVSPIETNAIVRGMVLSGLSPTASPTISISPYPGGGSARFGYDACKVLAAARRVARLSLVPNTWWEPGAY